MHKLLPVLILVVLGGMVVYSITRPNANFSPNKYAYDLEAPAAPTPTSNPKPDESPLPKPDASGKPDVSATPIVNSSPIAVPDPVPNVPTPAPTPVPKCISDGNRCEAGIVCCGFCDRSTGVAICASLSGNVCVPVGSYCRVGGKHCCNGECVNQYFGFGICPHGWQ